MPRRRRRVRRLHVAVHHAPRSAAARTPSRSARSTPPATPTRRPRAAASASTRAAPDTTLDRRHRRPGTDNTPTFTFTSETGRDVPVPHRRRRVRGLHVAVHHRAARRRHPHVRRPRHRRRRQRRPDAGDADVRGRHDRAEHDADAGPTARPTTRRRPSRFTSNEAGATLRVPRRRRRVRRLHVAVHRRGARRRARTRSTSAPSTPPATSTRPPATQTFTVDTTAPDTDADAGHRRRATTARRRSRSPPSAGGDVPVPGRRRRVRGLHLAAHDRRRWPTGRTRSRSAPSTPPATSTPRPTTQTFVIDTGAPNTTIDSGPDGPDQRRHADVHVQRRRGRARSSAGSTARDVRALHLAVHDARARRRRAHLRGPRDATARQRRRDAGDPRRSPSTRRRRPRPTSSPARPGRRPRLARVRLRRRGRDPSTCRLDGPAGAVGEFGACASPKSFSGAGARRLRVLRALDRRRRQPHDDASARSRSRRRSRRRRRPRRRRPPRRTPTAAGRRPDVVVDARGRHDRLVLLKAQRQVRPARRAGASRTAPRSTRARASSSSRAADGGEPPETAEFYDGLFIVTQTGGVTELKLSEKLTGCPKAKKSRRAAAAEEAQDPQAVGRRQGQVPHQGPVQRGHRPRHQVARPGHLHHDAHPRHPGRRRGQRLRQEEDGPVKKGKRYTAQRQKRRECKAPEAS